MVKWLGSLIELLAILGGAGPLPSKDDSASERERKRRREYEEWQQKHGSKRDKDS